MAKKKRKIKPAPVDLRNIKPSDLRRCDACGAYFGSEATLAAHAKLHVEQEPTNRLISKKRQGAAKPACAKFGLFKGSGWPMQGGAPGLGRK